MERMAICPQKVFACKWVGWAEFLGNGRIPRRKPEEWIPIADELAGKNGGKLQSMWWLTRNGYQGLGISMRKNPELFAHIIQEKLVSHANELVPIAEHMARRNGGKLQNAKWLETNGYRNLAYAMRRKPNLFSHVKQERRDCQGRLINDARGEVG